MRQRMAISHEVNATSSSNEQSIFFLFNKKKFVADKEQSSIAQEVVGEIANDSHS